MSANNDARMAVLTRLRARLDRLAALLNVQPTSASPRALPGSISADQPTQLATVELHHQPRRARRPRTTRRATG